MGVYSLRMSKMGFVEAVLGRRSKAEEVPATEPFCSAE